MAEEKIELTIVADWNDADYVKSVCNIDEDELEIMRPLFEAISEFKPYTVKTNSGFELTYSHNYPFGGYHLRANMGEKCPEDLYPNVSSDAISMFSDLLPMESDGVHSIISIKIRRIAVLTEEKFEYRG